MKSFNKIFKDTFAVMILFQQAYINLYREYKHELKALYLQAFTKGISAQHISDDEAKNYLDEMFRDGYGIFGFSDNQLIAALISVSPSLDKERPASIQNHYPDKDTEYIAEVLVDENFRGMGIGKKIMQKYENQLSETTKHVLLRVWDKNEAAVSLYQKSGFTACGSIDQTKFKPITKEPFTMHKIYMLKTY